MSFKNYITIKKKQKIDIDTNLRSYLFLILLSLDFKTLIFSLNLDLILFTFLKEALKSGFLISDTEYFLSIKGLLKLLIFFIECITVVLSISKVSSFSFEFKGLV